MCIRNRIDLTLSVWYYSCMYLCVSVGIWSIHYHDLYMASKMSYISFQATCRTHEWSVNGCSRYGLSEPEGFLCRLYFGFYEKHGRLPPKGTKLLTYCLLIITPQSKMFSTCFISDWNPGCQGNQYNTRKDSLYNSKCHWNPNTGR